MNPILNKNLESLRTIYPEIHQAVVNNSDESYRTIPSNDKSYPNLEYKKLNRSILYYSPINPANEVSHFIDKLNFSDPNFLILFGIGLGYHLEMLIERFPKIQKIIVVEKDVACFKRALEISDFTRMLSNSRITFLISCHEENLYLISQPH